MPEQGAVRSVVEQIVSVQESIRTVLSGLTQLATGSECQVRELERAQQRLAVAQQQTDEKLDAMIAIVDSLVRERK